MQGKVVDRLFKAYFVEGRDIGDRDVLIDIAGECGLDARLVEKLLAEGADADLVREEIAQAQAIGVSGVPFFIFAGRLGVPGAQDPSVLRARDGASAPGDERAHRRSDGPVTARLRPLHRASARSPSPASRGRRTRRPASSSPMKWGRGTTRSVVEGAATFRPWTIDQPLLLPPSVQDFVGEDHLARFILALVLEPLDLGEIEAAYASERGQPPFDPAMMTALLLYGYCNGVYSSRRIAKAARERVDFLSIVGLDPPDFRTVSDFRKRHLKALAGLFGQVLKLCEQAGLVKLGHVALDGTKIKANASKHKAMSYERMEKRAAELEAEVERWLSAAEAADAEEDRAFGRDKSGAELPKWVADKKKRVEKIRAAKAELEAEAKAAAAAKAKAQAEVY